MLEPLHLNLKYVIGLRNLFNSKLNMHISYSRLFP